MASAVGELAERNAVRAAVEAQLDAVVHEALAAHALSGPGVVDEPGDPELDDASANPPLDVVAAAALQDDGVDALALEQVAEEEPRGAGADDGHLGSKLASRSPSTDSSPVRARAERYADARGN